MYQNTVISVPFYCSFGAFTVHRVGFGDALKGLSGVWPSPVVAAQLVRRNPKGWLGTLNTCATAFG
jgi:hypothetical protein